MLDPTGFTLFLAASAVLIITPGPAVLYIVTRGLSQGRWAGMVSALGVALGNLGHALAAAAGLSAVLASSAAAFAAVKYLGAAYLVYLGLRKFFPPAAAPAAADPAPERPGRIFRQGLFVSLLNPKTALFFLAFLPQFADPVRGAVWRQVLLLGLVFVGLAAASDSAYAWLSGSLGRWLSGPGFSRSGRYASGLVYCGLGIVAALSGSRPAR